MKYKVKVVMFLVFVSALALYLSGCSQSTGQTGEDTPLPATSTSVPTRGPSLSSTVVEASGVVQPARWIELSFQQKGVVAEVAVTPGDKVQAGQLLARLEVDSLEQTVVQAEVSLAIAQAQLAQTQAGARPEELAAAEATVDAAKAQLTQAQAELSQVEHGVEIAQASLTQTQAQLVATQAGQAQAEASLSEARTGLASAQAALAQLLAGPDEETVEIARLNWELAKNVQWQTQLERDAVVGRSGVPDYQREVAKAVFWAAELSASIAQLQYGLAGRGATDEQLQQAQATVDSTRAQVSQAGAQLDVAKAEVEQTQGAIEEAQSQVAQAEDQVEGARAQVDRAQAQLDQARAQRDLLLAGAQAEELTVLEAQVKWAEAALVQARLTLEETQLLAPFAGTVVAVEALPSEALSTGRTVVVLADLDALCVHVLDLDEFDVARVKPDQTVRLLPDALPGRELSGRVTSVSLRAIDLEGDTVYPIVVEILDPDPDLRWGMTVIAEIATTP